jgi:hypothetical protein
MPCYTVIAAKSVTLCALLDQHGIRLEVVENEKGEWRTYTSPRVLCLDQEAERYYPADVSGEKSADEAVKAICERLSGVKLQIESGSFWRSDRFVSLHNTRVTLGA